MQTEGGCFDLRTCDFGNWSSCLLVPWGRRHLQWPQSWIQSEDDEGAQHVNFRGGAILGVGLGLQFDPQAPGDVS